MYPFRNTLPVRTCTKIYASHLPYKPFLREDFNKRCGYCDDQDIHCNGVRGFHIDHFRPRNHFQHRKSDYNNLVYACPYCNGGKSDDWPSGTEEQCILDGKGYVDPCDSDYDNHFERNSDGKIRPLTDIGQYMFRQLKLGLRRHELAWKLEQLKNNIHQLENERENFSGDALIKQQIDDYLFATMREFFIYKCAFDETL